MQINEPINRQKQLNIIAIVDDSDYGKSVFCYGIKLAKVFSASLMVVSYFGTALEPKKQSSVTLPNFDNVDKQGVSISVRSDYFFPERLHRFAEDSNTIMYVIGVNDGETKGAFSKRGALRFIKSSRLPVMTVGRTLPKEEAFHKVVLPIDIEKRSKEKALWAGYFSRFYNASILLIYKKYEDEELQQQVKDNIAFVKKLYENLEVTYQTEEVESASNVDLYSLTYAQNNGATLTVIMMTHYYTLADVLFGPNEKRIVGNSMQFPVLCINPRDDLFVLCT